MIVYGDLTEKSGRSALDDLLAQGTKPTAIFCMSDAAAAGVLAGAHTRGIKVPGELSVAGCGDDYCAQFTYPSLTTVHVPLEEMAAAAVQEIERLVREPLLEEPMKRILPVRLVVRETTGAPI